MRKNAIAAHDDSHRTKNSLTGIAGTSSVKYSIARQRNGNADHDACRHGNIREAQELAYGDGYRARNRRDNVAARQPLRKEQADKERSADKGCNGVGTSTTAPTMAPIVHETPHVAMRITLSAKDSRGPQSSPSTNLASEMPYASSVSVAATASV